MAALSSATSPSTRMRSNTLSQLLVRSSLHNDSKLATSRMATPPWRRKPFASVTALRSASASSRNA
eukprot:3054041-Pyramimonas_sp.AAC.1